MMITLGYIGLNDKLKQRQIYYIIRTPIRSTTNPLLIYIRLAHRTNLIIFRVWIKQPVAFFAWSS